MNSRQHRYADAAVNLAEGLTGSVFSFGAVINLLGEAELQAALPYWGLIQGFVKVVQSGEAFYSARQKERDSDDEPHAANPLDYAELGANGLLVGLPFVPGAVALIPWNFALVAVFEFVIATKSLYDTLMFDQSQSSEAFSATYGGISHRTKNFSYLQEICKAIPNIIAKLLAVIGWTTVALGNPVGWALIGLASLHCVYKAGAAYFAIKTEAASSAHLELGMFNRHSKKTGVTSNNAHDYDYEPINGNVF